MCPPPDRPTAPGPRPLLLLGATGSIGSSTIDLVRRWPGEFAVWGATARRRGDELARLCREFPVERLALTDPAAREEFAARHRELTGGLAAEGEKGLLELVEEAPVGTMVVNGLVGAAGLRPTVAALRRGLDVALANKEALVVGGPLVLDAAREGGARLWPVDSEHSAIAQCLRGNPREELRRIWLTASGGPFRDRPVEELARVRLEEVLDHPTWKMGPKITVDSATMMNKGLEVIEAHHLFGVPIEEIGVVLHRQSIVHSMIELQDGAFLAQLGAPDMRIPLLFALTEGRHRPAELAPFDPLQMGPLSFEAPDPRRYPCLALARNAAESSAAGPIVLNAANEEAVAGLLRGNLSFTEIAPLIERALSALAPAPPSTVEEALAIDEETRRHVRAWISSAHP